MNFQSLPTVDSAQVYLDIAFKAARDYCKENKFKAKTETALIRSKEVTKIDIIQKKLCGAMNNIVKKFPVYDDMDDFYQELFKCYMDPVQYKSDLSKAKWVELKVASFAKKYTGLLKGNDSLELIHKLSKEFYGRISSVLDRANKPFGRLHEFRQKLRQMPDIKPDCVNVALFGFPNVGKSTLLSKLTSARPEIASYAFTTKRINMGYSNVRSIKIQIMDTPGTLNRFEKMNDIEKMAYLVVSKLADCVIYVFDPTGTYAIEDQEALFEVAKEHKNCVPLVSKLDLVESEKIDEFREKYGCITIDELDSVFEKLAGEKELELIEKISTQNSE